MFQMELVRSFTVSTSVGEWAVCSVISSGKERSYDMHSTLNFPLGGTYHVEGTGMCYPYGWVLSQTSLKKGLFFDIVFINMGGLSRN